MKVAFHFDIDTIHAQYKRMPYYLVILEKVFRTFLDGDLNYVHSKISYGDLLIREYIGHKRDEETLTKVMDGLLGVDFPVWRDINHRFYKSIFSKEVAVVALEGLNSRVRNALLIAFKKENSYLGAIQIYGANKVHWDLYNQGLSHGYRYIDKELRIFYSNPDGDDKDLGLEEHWSMLPFKSICWENVGYQHTFLNTYDTFDHAKRLAALGDILSDHLLQLADDILLRTGDLNAQLQEELYSALRTFNLAQTAADFAQVAGSCRRFIEFLADTLYATIDDKKPLLNKEGRPYPNKPYLAKYRRYIEAKLGTLEREKRLVLTGLEDLNNRLGNMNDLSNKSLHDLGAISLSDLNRLLIAMVTVTYDVLSLAPPPVDLPSESHQEGLLKLFDKVKGGLDI